MVFKPKRRIQGHVYHTVKGQNITEYKPFGREIRIGANRNTGFQHHDLSRCTSDNSRLVVKWNDCKITVKASTFGLHGNFGPIFPEELAITKTRPTEEEWNKSCRQTFNLQSRFCSFLENSPKEATDLGRNGPKFR